MSDYKLNVQLTTEILQKAASYYRDNQLETIQMAFDDLVSAMSFLFVAVDDSQISDVMNAAEELAGMIYKKMTKDAAV
jgi:hypothetical protein